MELLVDMAAASWRVLKESALFVLFGFAVAGVLHVFLTPESVSRYFRTGRFRSVLYASLLGVPIPL